MKTKFCESCGQKMNDEHFCSNCGKEVSNYENKKNNNPLNIIISIIRYGIGSFFILGGLTDLPKIDGFICIVLGLSCFPFIYKLIIKKFHIQNPKSLEKIQIIIPILLFFIWGFILPSNDTANDIYKENSSDNNTEINVIKKVEVTVQDFSKMKKEDIKKWCDTNLIVCSFYDEYSSEKKGNFVRQSVNPDTTIYQGDSIIIYYSLGKEPTNEELNALKKAETYSELMHMSKKGIYDQLVSSYGEGFDKSAAQYAIDNIQADWNANALAKAKDYRSTLNMSKKAIYNQLISDYGEKFTKSQAQYAIDHLDD